MGTGQAELALGVGEPDQLAAVLRMDHEPADAAMLHPGEIDTELLEHTHPEWVQPLAGQTLRGGNDRLEEDGPSTHARERQRGRATGGTCAHDDDIGSRHRWTKHHTCRRAPPSFLWGANENGAWSLGHGRQGNGGVERNLERHGESRHPK